MAFGALLGASTYVCMNVVGMVILLKPKGPMQANLALVRDVAGYLILLLVMLPIFMSGLSRFWVIVLNGMYAALTGVRLRTAPVAALPFSAFRTRPPADFLYVRLFQINLCMQASLLRQCSCDICRR